VSSECVQKNPAVVVFLVVAVVVVSFRRRLTFECVDPRDKTYTFVKNEKVTHAEPFFYQQRLNERRTTEGWRTKKETL